MIPTRTTFKQSELLKEKGFNLLVNHLYNQNGKLIPRTLESGNEPIPFEPDDFYENFNSIFIKYQVDGVHQTVISAPEQWQVIEWLRINHGICIHSKPENDEKDFCVWEFVILTISKKEVYFTKRSSNYSTPQEATSAAIDYVLEKLI